MDTNLLKELERCSKSIWFGYSEGVWYLEELVDGEKVSTKPDSKLMYKLHEYKFIEFTGDVSSGSIGRLLQTWKISSEGNKALEDNKTIIESADSK